MSLLSVAAPTVAAVAPQKIESLAGQTRVPDLVVTGPDALARGLAAGAGWIWLLGHGAIPRADALERLLDAGALPSAAAAPILAGRVIDARGGTLERHLPAWSTADTGLVELVGRRVLPIRHTPFANCLVPGECFLRHGLPDADRYGPYAPAEWSARAIRESSGYFIPSSVVELDEPDHREAAWRSIPALARMLRTGAWTRGDVVSNVADLVRRSPARDPV